MRFISIFIFIIIFNMSLSMISSMGIYNFSYSELGMGQNLQSSGSYFNSSLNSFNNTIKTVAPDSGGVGTGFSYLNAVYNLVVIGLPMMLKAFLDATILFPVMMANIGMPIQLNGILTSMVWMIEAIGFWQLVTGRSFKEMQ